MKKLAINIMENCMINLKVTSSKVDDNPISVVKNKKIVEEVSQEELDKGISKKIGKDYLLSYDPYNMKIKISEIKSGREVFSTKKEFIFKKEKETGLRFNYSSQEVILGLGQDHMGNLDNRNVERIFWHQNNSNYASNATVPFFLSSNGYGIFVDTSYPLRMAFGKPNTPDKLAMDHLSPTPFDWNQPSCENQEDTISIVSWEEPVLNLYLLLGEFQEVLNKYYDITGYPGLLPKWSYGYIQSKNRYKSADEMLKIGKMFREKNIPCDSLVLDWKWFKQFGDLEWDKENFGNIQEVMDELSDMGIKVIQAQHPMIEKDSLKYNEFKKKGLIGYSPKGDVNFDHFHKDAKNTWWNEIEKFYNDGVRGYWTDMGEPKTDSPGNVMAIGNREKYHNFYTYFWSKNLFESHTETKNTRPFILARTQSPGIQKYNTALWSSDIGETWEVLGQSVIQLQNVCMSGQPNWCTDIGGFIPNKEFSPELLVRWHNWGIFCPLYRTHGTKPENEPWSYGEEVEQLMKKNLELRYSLFPYIYSNQRNVSKYGTMFIRPCFVDYKEKSTLSYKYQYMFGDILVSPIVNYGQRIKDTYLPGGYKEYWYDFYSGRKLKGGQTIKSTAPIEKIPLYVRENSMIIQTNPHLSAQDIYSEYHLSIFGQGNSNLTVYEDDGETYEYQNEIYNEFTFESSSDGVKIRTKNKNYRINHSIRKINIKLFKDENDIYEYQLDYNIGDETFIKYDDFKKQSAKKDNAISVHVDTMDRLKDGTIYLNTLIVNNEDLPGSYTFEVEIPKHYFFDDVSLKSKDTFVLNDYYQRKVKIVPYGYKMPQHEKIKVLVKDCQGELIYEEQVTLGNGYMKNWKVSVSKDPIYESTTNFVRADKMENNPWGYVNLLDFINIRYKGSRPIDLQGYTDIKEGFGKSFVNIYSPQVKEVYFRVKGDSSFNLRLNHVELISTNKFREEIVVPGRLEKGHNVLQFDLTFLSDHPLTGREFGFSAQVLNKEQEIDEEILVY